LNKEEVKLEADADFQLKQMVEILRAALLKRNIENSSMDVGDSVHSGKRFPPDREVQAGDRQRDRKKLVKLIKDSKIKVQAAIQGDEVRVTGKKRDDLQETMALVRGAELGQHAVPEFPRLMMAGRVRLSPLPAASHKKTEKGSGFCIPDTRSIRTCR
jgi:uncharacterized protein YajQ (UPF0234 family)